MTSSDDAEILDRKTEALSPWVSVDEVRVRMPGQAGEHIYHGVRQANSVSILAMTPDGRVPIVRQFRPVAGAWTWELPSGFCDDGETAEAAGARELREETGFEAAKVIKLVESFELPARLTSRFFALFILAAGDLGTPEPGMELKLVDGPTLKRLAQSGELALPANVACLYLASVNEAVRAACAELGFAEPPWL